ncbi:MAG: hypothetical protein R3B40_04765 [Polyangiales bacterium]|nr:hypothetical protein [Myxococcales bacterium]MCB9662124.1 hypothetical protein [Sandaracinaceae bacterium]
MTTLVDDLAATLVLGALLERLTVEHGGYELLGHHTQGEFHHDVILRVPQRRALPGDVLVVSTNCNGGIKEVLVFEAVPSAEALWHHRCPTEPEFAALPLPPIVGLSRTLHYFDPCELLVPDARSELRPEHRRRQRGGGWEKV